MLEWRNPLHIVESGTASWAKANPLPMLVVAGKNGLPGQIDNGDDFHHGVSLALPAIFATFQSIVVV